MSLKEVIGQMKAKIKRHDIPDVRVIDNGSYHSKEEPFNTLLKNVISITYYQFLVTSQSRGKDGIVVYFLKIPMRKCYLTRMICS